MAKGGNALLIGAGVTTLALIFFAKSDKKEDSEKIKIKPGKGPVDFILTYLPYAQQANKFYPQIPVEVFLSFSGLESGFGKAAPRFNFFGLKAPKSWTGKKQIFKTREVLPKATGYNFPKVYSITKRPDGKFLWVVDDYFLAFDTPLEAFLYFGKFITSGRYKKAFGSVFSIPEIVAKIRKVWAAGYATDPNYVKKHEKIVTLIRDVITKYKK